MKRSLQTDSAGLYLDRTSSLCFGEARIERAKQNILEVSS